MDNKCVCGHTRRDHFESLINGLASHTFVCSCVQFKLDNLQLIEDLAKERNLI